MFLFCFVFDQKPAEHRRPAFVLYVNFKSRPTRHLVEDRGNGYVINNKVRASVLHVIILTLRVVFLFNSIWSTKKTCILFYFILHFIAL